MWNHFHEIGILVALLPTIRVITGYLILNIKQQQQQRQQQQQQQ